jgi:hypothetical protein
LKNSPLDVKVQTKLSDFKEKNKMDIVTLALSAGAYLAPLLPYLAKPAAEVGETVVKEIGMGTWNRAKELWNKLTSSDESQALNKTAEKVGGKITEIQQSDLSEAEKAQQVKNQGENLATQIEILLDGNPDLVAEIEKLISEAQNADNGGTAFNIQNQVAEKIANVGVVHGDFNM